MHCFTGGPDFIASLRHYCVSTDELSVTGRKGGREGEASKGRKTEKTRREREWGVAACETHSRITE